MAKPLPKEYPLETVSLTNKNYLILRRKEQLLEYNSNYILNATLPHDEEEHGEIIKTAEVPLRLIEENFFEAISCIRCLLECLGEHDVSCLKDFRKAEVEIEIDDAEELSYAGWGLFWSPEKHRRFLSGVFRALTGKRKVKITVRLDREYLLFEECPGCILSTKKYHDIECRYINS